MERKEETNVVRDNDAGTVRQEESRVTNVGDAPMSDTRVVSSVAPARRAIELVYLLFGIIDGMLLIRLLLKLMAANVNVPFAGFVYGFSDIFLTPFRGLLATWVSGRSVLELSVVIAILVYALIAYALARLIAIIFSRSVMVSHRSQTGGLKPGPD
jgi:uncharacterized protein YggT (Ycf19 family)